MVVMAVVMAVDMKVVGLGENCQCFTSELDICVFFFYIFSGENCNYKYTLSLS